MEPLERIESKLDRLDERMGKSEAIQAEHNAILKEHMRRTQIAEERIELVHAEVRPLARVHAMWAGVGKLLAILSLVAAVVAAVAEVISALRPG